MLEIIICWSLAGIIGYVFGKLIKAERDLKNAAICESESPTPGACSLNVYNVMEMPVTPLSAVLAECLHEMKARGVDGKSLLLLDCCNRQALAGDLNPETAIFLLDRIGGAEAWIERIKGAGL